MEKPTEPSTFDIIVACSWPEGGIGVQGRLPWSLPEDMRRFRRRTLRAVDSVGRECPGQVNAVIMGRKTWESLPGKMLPGRLNIVLTSDSSLLGSSCSSSLLAFLPCLDAALNYAQGRSDVARVFVIGGQRVYREALLDPRLDTVWLTLVTGSTVTSYDSFFPVAQAMSQMVSSDAADADICNDAPSGITCRFKQLQCKSHGPQCQL